MGQKEACDGARSEDVRTARRIVRGVGRAVPPMRPVCDVETIRPVLTASACHCARALATMA